MEKTFVHPIAMIEAFTIRSQPVLAVCMTAGVTDRLF